MTLINEQTLLIFFYLATSKVVTVSSEKIPKIFTDTFKKFISCFLSLNKVKTVGTFGPCFCFKYLALLTALLQAISL